MTETSSRPFARAPRLTRSCLVTALAAGALACGAGQPGPTAATQTPSSAPADVTRSIVLVDADGVDPDMASPWGTGKSWTRTLTGLVVSGHRILVCGWSLRGHQHIHVLKEGATARSEAHQILTDPDEGLSLLTVDDPAFWTGLTPAVVPDVVPSTGPAHILHATSAAAVETSGANIAGYRSVGRAEILGMKLAQVDTKQVVASDVLATGGAVLGVVLSVNADEVAAFTSRTLADFLAEAARPIYRGYAAFGAKYQSLKTRAQREELGVAGGDGGVRITAVHRGGTAKGVLSPGDILLTISGKKIDADGTVERPVTGRVPFTSVLTDGHHPGDVIALGIQRDGARRSVDLTLKTWPNVADLVPWFAPSEEGKAYVVEGGLVFQTLSGDYVHAFGKDWEARAPSMLLEAFELDRCDGPATIEHIVVLTRVLADPATLGYQQVHDLVVDSINGVPLRSIDDVHSAFAHPRGEFDVVTFSPGQAISRLVLDAKEAAAASERLRATYELPVSSSSSP